MADPITVKTEIVEDDAPGAHDQKRTTQYIPTLDADGNVLPDPYREYDIWVADQAARLLEEAYPGYGWRTMHDTARNKDTGNHDKILLISIPVLMGINNYIAINRQQTELTEGRVLAAGGEILERYGQRRGRMQLAQFLEARAKHSALVNRSRKVPE